MLLGLVGKPSCGKSTFFKAATLAEIPIASYPFTTIKANTGVGYVKVDCIDKEFETQCNPKHGFCLNHNRFVPIQITDVAGLVPGASQGKGLGNQFLDDLREADAFIHVVDASGNTDEEGKPTENFDPCKDIDFLEKELDEWYYNIFMKAWKRFVRKVEMQDRKFSEEIATQFSGLKVKEDDVKEVLRSLNLPEKPTNWDEEQIKKFTSHLRKKTKPMIIAANKVDTEKGKENYRVLRDKFPKLNIVPCSADSELALREASKAGIIDYIPGEKTFKIREGKANEKQKAALEKIQKNVLDVFEEGTGVQSVLNSAVFGLLKYIAVFPASANKLEDSKGNTLPDCFLLPEGSTALDFAYFLHTDFGDNFIKAIDAKSKRDLGKDHKVNHRDAIEIITR